MLVSRFQKLTLFDSTHLKFQSSAVCMRVTAGPSHRDGTKLCCFVLLEPTPMVYQYRLPYRPVGRHCRRGNYTFPINSCAYVVCADNICGGVRWKRCHYHRGAITTSPSSHCDPHHSPGCRTVIGSASSWRMLVWSGISKKKTDKHTALDCEL
jgi:hypothetical protein